METSPALGLAELLVKRELDLAVQAPVGAFVLVRRLPVRSGVVLGPLRHVPVLFVFQFLPVLLVAPLGPPLGRFLLPMLPSPPAMEPQEELEQLLARKETLKQELKARKKELQDAQRRQRDNLKRQIQRAQSRTSAAERKRRTRRLILMGSYLEHVAGDDPCKRDSLMKGRDGFLERDRDRGLFDLPPNKEISDGNSG